MGSVFTEFAVRIAARQSFWSAENKRLDPGWLIPMKAFSAFLLESGLGAD